MGNIADKIKVVTDNFAQSATETISSTALVKNAISDNISRLNTNPQLKRIGTNDYISFGNSDDMPDILSALLDKSTTHSGIIRKKAKMVAGKQMVSDVDDKKWKTFFENAGGYGVSLYELFLQACFEFEKQGGFLLVVDADVEGKTTEPILLQVLGHKRFRLMPPEDGVIKQVLVRDVFKRVSGKVFSNEEEIIDMFDPTEKQEKYCIYVKNPFSTNPFYGTPNYIAAFDFIESDFEFGRTIKNSARNGFAPRLLTTFIGRNMNDEQKADEASKFKSNFQGADSENVIISFVRRAEDKPQFDKLDIQNLDKTIDVMAKLNDSKILTAHNVTSPTLFGIMVSGKLGGTGTELYSAYELFRTTDILPDRDVILNGFRIALSTSIFKDATFEIEDIDMSFLATGIKDENNNNNEEQIQE
jgi:hypothetical protein